MADEAGFEAILIYVKPENLSVVNMPNLMEAQRRTKERPLFDIGTQVKIQGLVNAKQHNGKTGGVIKTYDEETGRVSVRLSDGATIDVKPANLVLESRVVEQFLPRSISEILAMTKLKLNGQGITDLTGIEMMDSLVDLDLENNEIVCLAPQRFPKSLRTLNLSNNRIKSLKECFYSKTRFQKLLDLPPEFEEYREGVDTRLEAVKLPNKLEVLTVCDNEIDSIDDVVFPSSLTTLSLEGNRIRLLDHRVSFPDSLRLLDLSENDITSVEGTVFPPKLKELRLGSNPIDSIERVRLPTNLEILRLPKTCKVSKNFLLKYEPRTSPRDPNVTYILKEGGTDSFMTSAIAAAAAAAPSLPPPKFFT